MVAVSVGLIVLFLTSLVASSDDRIASAMIQSCTGCYLRKYPDVKKFIEFDIPDFEGVTFKAVPGAIPEIVFFDKHDEELERHSLIGKTREDCSKLLLEKGFRKISKASPENHNHEDI